MAYTDSFAAGIIWHNRLRKSSGQHNDNKFDEPEQPLSHRHRSSL